MPSASELGLLIPSAVGRTEWPEAAELVPDQGGVPCLVAASGRYSTAQYRTTTTASQRSAGQGRPGTDAMAAFGSAALGWAFPTLPIHPPGKFSPDTRSAPAQFSPACFAHSPQRRFDLALSFSFSFPTPPPPAPPVLCFFSLLRPYCCDFKRSILSRAFCRRCLPPFCRWCFPQSSSTVYTHHLESRPPRFSRVNYPAAQEYGSCLLPGVFESKLDPRCSSIAPVFAALCALLVWDRVMRTWTWIWAWRWSVILDGRSGGMDCRP